MKRAFAPGFVVVVAVVVVASVSARADDDPLPLIPLTSVHRPAPVDDNEALDKIRGCATKPPPALKDRLPFGPGEQLSFDIALLGIRTGKASLKVGEKSTVDGVLTYPIQAEVKTDSFLEVFGHFDARMVSFFDPSTLVPVRMVNHVTAREPFQSDATESREDAAFAKGGINARLTRSGHAGPFDKKSHMASGADVVDVLSVVYWLRARELDEKTPFCFELYHRRRLWHVEGSVVGTEIARPPSGAKRAKRLEATITRVGGKDPPPPRPITAWVSDDADRWPLLVSTPNDKIGNVEIRLTSYTRGRRLVAK